MIFECGKIDDFSSYFCKNSYEINQNELILVNSTTTQRKSKDGFVLRRLLTIPGFYNNMV